jgi:hypothetical protein
MVNSGRDPERRPRGYQELEIALRRHGRILEDLSTSLTFDARGPVEMALRSVLTIRNEILRLLFPNGVSTI